MKTTWALLMACILLLSVPAASLARSTSDRDHRTSQQNIRAEQRHERDNDLRHDRGWVNQRNDRDHRRDGDHRWQQVNHRYGNHRDKHRGHPGHGNHYHYQNYLYPCGGRLIIPLPPMPLPGFRFQLHW